MSSPATSDDEDTAKLNNINIEETEPTKKIRYKRKKIAIFFAYCGAGYQGMQKNPGAKTIEGELELALHKAGAVPDLHFCQPRSYDFARSARTDKGVSAVGQVISGRFYVDPPGIVDRLNGILPGQIRVFGIKRTTGAFNAKKFCDRRRYVYLIPVFALDSGCHRDRESVIASLGSGVELVKCLECSERGRKVEGVMGNNRISSSNSSSLNGNGSVGDAEIKSEVKEETLENGGGGRMLDYGMGNVVSLSGNGIVVSEDLGSKVKKEIEDGLVEDGTTKTRVRNERSDVSFGVAVEERNDVDGEEKIVMKEDFVYGELEKQRFNRILNYYVGTHNFHNFTTRLKPEDPAANRYIISFNADTTVTLEGIEFVKCEVVGQSFMLHQIRKMIGLAVAIMRSCAPESLIEIAFRKDVNINVPMAPEVGLYLDECFFTSYNQKWKDTHEELSMKAYREEAEEFKMKYIYSHIASMEHKEGVVALWLHSLNYCNYPDLRFADSFEAVEAKDTSKENAGEIPVDDGAGEGQLGGENLDANGAGEGKVD